MALLAKEKNGLLMVFKPKHTPTTKGSTSNALTEQVVAAYPNQKIIQGFHDDEGGLLYRLDTTTSGLVLFATTQSMFDQFIADSKAQQITKHYLAYVTGTVGDSRGIITFPIGHHPRNQRKMVAQVELSQKARSQWRPAKTIYRVLQHDDHGNTWLHLSITLGCRHQIRVHCAAIGHPLVNDPLYNDSIHKDQEMHLRCQRIEWQAQDQSFDLTELAVPQEDTKYFPQLAL